MPRHVDVYMDGKGLKEVGPFLLQTIKENAPKLEVSASSLAARPGQRLALIRRQTLSVSLEIAIQETQDLSARARWFNALAAWARGQWLEVSYRPGQRLSVSRTVDPALDAVRNYATAIKLEFTAYAVPYWQDCASVARSGPGTLILPGTADAPLLAEITPSDTLTRFTLTAADSALSFTGLSIPAGKTITLSRTPFDTIAVSDGAQSLLPFRTADSDDDLIVAPGPVKISLDADAECTSKFYTYARWL